MTNPFFYDDTILPGTTSQVLNEETSKHVIQVLRMKKEEQLLLTNGKGYLFSASIESEDRKKCIVKIHHSELLPKPGHTISIAISLIKNSSRFEWFLEKATEIGVSEIIPLICDRTEKQRYRQSRFHNILISSMLQSRQTWLPCLHQATKFKDFIKRPENQHRFIAHCGDNQHKKLLSSFQPFNSSIILIGPEGDFTNDEIKEAKENNFLPVSLGESRLRTETAGIVAAALLKNF